MTLKQSQSAEPAANDGALAVDGAAAIDAETRTAAESAENEPSASSGRMATFYRNRLFGRTGEVYASIAPGFFLKNLPSDCPMVIALYSLLQFMEQQELLLKEEKTKLEDLENLNKHKAPEIGALMREYEDRREERKNTLIFKKGPKQKEAMALQSLKEHAAGIVSEQDLNKNADTILEALRLWLAMLPRMIESARRHQVLLEQEVTLYRIRYMKLRSEFVTLRDRLPEGELEGILAGNEQFKEMYEIIMSANFRIDL